MLSVVHCINVTAPAQSLICTRKKLLSTSAGKKEQLCAGGRKSSCTFPMINRGRLEFATSPILNSSLFATVWPWNSLPSRPSYFTNLRQQTAITRQQHFLSIKDVWWNRIDAIEAPSEHLIKASITLYPFCFFFFL